jgi:hypothetical protein
MFVCRVLIPPLEGRGGRDSKRGGEEGGFRWSPTRWRRLVSGFVSVSVGRA